MFRPPWLDWGESLLPAAVGVGAFAVGRLVRRLPRAAYAASIVLAVVVVVLTGLCAFTPLRAALDPPLYALGGGSLSAAAMALFLLGVVWAVPGRSLSSGFLGTMAGVVVFILLLQNCGRLLWRYAGQAAWDNRTGADGGLIQTSGYTCAPASGTMLLGRHGYAVSEGEVAYRAGTTFFGTDARDLARALDEVAGPDGWSAVVETPTYEDCVGLAPFVACCLVPGLGGHAVLVTAADEDGVELIDPRFGRRQRMSRDEFVAFWEGKNVRLTRR